MFNYFILYHIYVLHKYVYVYDVYLFILLHTSTKIMLQLGASFVLNFFRMELANKVAAQNGHRLVLGHAQWEL